MDNFVVEFEFQTSADDGSTAGSAHYFDFQMSQDPGYVWEYDDTEEPTWNEDKNRWDVPGVVSQHLKPEKGYNQVFDARSVD